MKITFDTFEDLKTGLEFVFSNPNAPLTNAFTDAASLYLKKQIKQSKIRPTNHLEKAHDDFEFLTNDVLNELDSALDLIERFEIKCELFQDELNSKEQAELDVHIQELKNLEIILYKYIYYAMKEYRTHQIINFNYSPWKKAG